MKRFGALAATALALAAATTTAFADSYEVRLYGTVTDAGQVVDRMVIDYGKGATVSAIDVDTFTVHALASTAAARDGTYVVSYGDYEIDRTIVKVAAKKNLVTVYFSQAEGATLAYLSAARNYPAELTYTITQNKALTLKKGGKTASDYTADYTCSGDVTDEEAALFTSVSVPGGINYQFYAPKKKAKTLIVWFHGNGEGDYDSSGNNVAQLLANRGAVAWASPEAQKIFGNAYVMAFQAPDTWYYATQDGLLEKAKDEIDAVVQKYGIDPHRIVLSGCSAGGYMSTRMIIAYPDLFSAALINCPALDVADARGGQTPTDDELETIRASRTAIWLVQGENDGVVDTEQCSKRLFATLTEGTVTTSATFPQELASDFTTEQTADKQYLLTLYATTSPDRAQGKLQFAEDYNQDGTLEQVEYSNHWSWIYTLRNNPKAADGTPIWKWAASKL